MVDFIQHIAEAAQIKFLYETAFPEFRIQLHFIQSDDVVPERAKVFIGDSNRFAGDTRQGYLGAWRTGSAARTAQVVNAFIYLPRVATQDEHENYGNDSAMRSKYVRALFGFSPFLISNLQYKLNQLRERRATQNISVNKIHGGPVFVDADTTLPEGQLTARPAILIGFHWLEHGGAEKLGYDTVQWALDAGLRVFVITQCDGLHRLENRLPDHPDVQFLRIDRYLDDNGQFRLLHNLVVQENIKIVHNHHCVPLYAALPMLRMAVPDIKVISSTHIWEYGNGGFVGLDGQWTDFIDIHHVISHQLSKLLEERFNIKSSVRLGRLLRTSEVSEKEPKFRLLPNAKQVTFAFIGRMSYQKDPILLAYIVKRLRRWSQSRNIDIHIKIVGDGPLLGPLKSMIKRFKLTEIVTFYPSNSDIPKLLDGADILLLPSANEGLALVCYEAIEHGVIPISSDVGAQSELVPQDLLFDAAPLHAIRECSAIVDRLTNDPTFLEQVKEQLRINYNIVKREPSAYEILMPHYIDAASLK